MVAHASAASSKHKIELDSYAGTCIVCDNCLVIHDHNGPVYVYSYHQKMATELLRQLMPQKGIKIHRKDRSLC